ncbi:glycosyltransferase [Synechococcus sp. UW105]|uniref:glycosyltransferase n=1 Tax=Synechococcus sp. UW105 TaxID=337067 RepID=UPI000E0ED40D
METRPLSFLVASDSFELVILTRDRPELLKKTVYSALKQTCPIPFKIIISDNSVCEETQIIVNELWPQIEYRRFHDLPAAVHFSSAIKLCASTYLMLFHDDDIFLDNCIWSMINAIQANPGFSAVACNARLISDQSLTRLTMFRAKRNDRLLSICSQRHLIARYIDSAKGSICPFPSYIYRSSCIDSSLLDYASSVAGKHWDLVFLLSVLNRAPFLWISRPLVAYRIHNGQDSFTHNVKDWMSLMRHLYSVYDLPRRSLVTLNYKANFYRKALRLRPFDIFSRGVSRRTVLARMSFLLICKRLLLDPRYLCSVISVYLNRLFL